MIEWNLFYKMLGIPEDVTEPTYYDLLGVHPKMCNAEIVDSMLQKRRSRLRQNIPGPQFIPLVLKFEQKKLEKAAKVLSSPKLREKYNRYLQRKALERKSEKHTDRTRQDLLLNARRIVGSLLNPDKTLDDSNRPILVEKLRNLGIKESNINSLLERIPRPALEAVKPNDESMDYFVTAVDLAISGNMLTPEAGRKIMELAKKLGIEQEQARNKIDQKLKERNARRGEAITKHKPGDTEQVLVASQRSRHRRNILPVTVMATAGVILISSVLFFVMRGRINLSESEPPSQKTSSNDTTSPSQPEPNPLVSDPPAGRETLDSIESNVESSLQGRNQTPKDFSPPPESPVTPSPEPSLPIQVQLPVKADDIRRIYSTSTGKDELSKDPALKEELLADLAVTMRVCYHRARHFVSGSPVFSGEHSGLTRQLQMSSSDRVADMVRQVDLVPMPPVTSLTNDESLAPNGRKTAEELLGSIKDKISIIKRKSRNPSQSMTSICRDLYLLSEMSDPDISQRLKAITPTSFKRIDLAITQTINQLSGSIPPPAIGGRRGRARYSFSRQISPGRITQHPTITPTSSPTVEPDPNSIKLLAVTAHYAGLTAKQLSEGPPFIRSSGTRYSRPVNRSEIYCSASDVGRKLLDELDTIAKQLISLTAAHPDQQYSEKAGAVARRMVSRKLASTTVLQKAVVSLDAIAETLELLVRQLEPSDELNKDFEQARREREQNRSRIDNAVHEFRESCYYNLRLWDILVEHSNGKIPVLPEGNRLPSSPFDLPLSKELAAKSEQQEHQQQDALNNLREGLIAYMNGHYEAAKQRLNKARQSEYVGTWADSELLTSLEDIHKKCEKALQDMSTCKKCDGSGLVACDACYGSGWTPCPQCRGKGKVSNGRMSYPCKNCKGRGYEICRKCNGKTFKKCELCTAKAGIGSHEKEAIEGVLAKAAYLTNGGIDLFTPEALKPPPKTQP